MSKKFEPIRREVCNVLSNGFGNSDINMKIDYESDPQLEVTIECLLQSCAYGLAMVIEEHQARMKWRKKK